MPQQYHKLTEELVDILCKKTQNTNRLFFRIVVTYYLTKVTSMMRISINTKDRGLIPINMYAINLAPSGQGKGHSTNIIEDRVINIFREEFLNHTLPIIAEDNLGKLAAHRAAKNNTDLDAEYVKVQKEYDTAGELAFSFDSGTTPAVKQMRHKLLMSAAGSMNMEIDEIGSNLLSNMDVLTTFLELFDVGKVKQKLIKNTSESVRAVEIHGRTPTNMMLFGTPNKLLDGDKTESEFMAMLEIGMARRCFFGVETQRQAIVDLSAEEIYNNLTDLSLNTKLDSIAMRLGQLAHKDKFNSQIQLPRDIAIKLINYKLQCERNASTIEEHDEVRRAELSHRYFKALKIAGTYAFIDKSPNITEAILDNAIALTEASGDAFAKLLTRERNYVKLAKYIASTNSELTHADLVEDLVFYKGSEAQKRDMMSLAIAYGYKNNIAIKRSYYEDIEFFSGDALEETSLEKLHLSYSTDIVKNYESATTTFNKLHKLMTLPNYHWVTHSMRDGYRDAEHAQAEFNLIVLDVDSGVSIELAKILLAEYTYLLHTTKRHTQENNRFRIILPMSHTLKLTPTEHKEFMSNVFLWTPFDVDTATGDIARKWATHPGEYHYNHGELVDSLLFIPKTTKSTAFNKKVISNSNLSNMERWFCLRTSDGNRNTHLLRYAFVLVDAGNTFDQVRDKVIALNKKLKTKIKEEEIMTTIMVSVAKKISSKN